MATRVLTPVVEAIGEEKALLGESVFYDPAMDRLYWVDIPGMALLSTDAATGKTDRISFPQQAGFVQPCEDGSLLVGQADSILHFDPRKGTARTFMAIEPDDPSTRTNDAVCDPRGRLIVGTMRPAPQGTVPDPIGNLYRINGEGTTARLLTDLSIPNGLAFSPGGRMLYLADTPCRTVWKATYDPETGRLGERCVFAELSDTQGRPDGAAVDVEGCYWVAAIWGWQLLRYTPRGELDLVVRLPVERPTKLAFGGPDCRTIYVASASIQLTDPESQPLAGRLIALDVNIAGLPASPFHVDDRGDHGMRGS
ncbi:MAG: SMP-30/gluconolactonase/LRE family protein [Rhizobiaceae bacterium]|nr:MAG: SMP-30/gluconolactonase/LRE family protein [Rhizobiaceae bacterium]